MTIADYIAVAALMIVLILWSATRLFPDYIALTALIALILWAAQNYLRNASLDILTQFKGPHLISINRPRVPLARYTCKAFIAGSVTTS